MTLNTGKIKYEVIREVFTGEVNDVYVCQNSQDRHSAYKTVWIVKNRSVAKSLIGGFANGGGGVCEEYFALGENMCFVFPYLQERPLFKFYISNIQEKKCSRQQIWLDIITQCMTKKLPGGILNLILKQSQIRLAPDGGIEFGYCLDLSEYDERISEADNVTLCAKRILELIYLEGTNNKDTAVMLLEKKLKRSKYSEFIQLFKDIKIIMQDNSDITKRERVKRFLVARQDRIYRILSVVCVVLVCIVVVNLISRLFIEDFSFWRLFTNPLEHIGTESMLN
jgi:hypothetical protein